MTNPTQPLTAETDAIDVVNLITKKILRGNIFVTSDAFKNYIKDTFEAYAAQQNAELVAEMKEQSHYVETLEAENERLKQHNKALIPLAAWSKKHGHELTCSIRKPIPDGVDRVVCNCGWVAAHNHSGLTTNQHIELAKYSDTQPPKEATACPDSCDDGYINGSGCCYKCL